MTVLNSWTFFLSHQKIIQNDYKTIDKWLCVKLLFDTITKDQTTNY